LQDGPLAVSTSSPRSVRPSVPHRGDSVTFVGVTSSFNRQRAGIACGHGHPPLTPPTSSTGSGNALPAPVVIPFSLTNTTPVRVYCHQFWPVRLVTLTNVYFRRQCRKHHRGRHRDGYEFRWSQLQLVIFSLLIQIRQARLCRPSPRPSPAFCMAIIRITAWGSPSSRTSSSPPPTLAVFAIRGRPDLFLGCCIGL